MKKLIFALVIAIAIFSLASCGNSSENPPEHEDVITVEDGYLVVNGVKTEYKVEAEDVITVEDGYLVVNGVKTEYKVDTEDVITVEDGYLVVNGVKTEYKVSECEHIWETVTTAPTCTAGGYDTMTCKLCEKSVKTNETDPIKHNYGNNYFTEDEYHWLKCIECDTVTDKELHTLGDDGVCTVCQLPVSATPGVIYDKSADGTYAEVVGYNGTVTKVKIAEEYQGLPVKNIYDNAFKSNSTIKSIVIPDSVITIGDYAFYNCYSLTSVVIPDSVTSIGSSAFDNCDSLTSVVIPDSVTSISDNAFYDCDSLKFNEYNNCKYLGSEDNPYFALIEVSNKNMSSYEIHEDARIIADIAFFGCSRLSSIIIPDSVTTIGEWAFSDCSSLTSVVIGDSVMSIGDYAFYGCSSLTSVVIGDSVTSIGRSAFSDCDSLTDVYYTGTEEEWAKISIGGYNSKLTSAEIHYNYVP